MKIEPSITRHPVRPDARFQIQTVRTVDVRMDDRSNETLGQHLDILMSEMREQGLEVNKVSLEVNPEL